MNVSVEEITCKSSLTGSGRSYRLNPYVGCEHRCEYCYATYIARWRGKSGPWGSWVQVKTNVMEVLAQELVRKKGIDVFLSTVCDVYQPLEQEYGITRQCLSVFLKAAQEDPGLEVFLLTKSDLVRRDVELLRAFPAGTLRVAFSVTTPRDEVAALFEPASPRPSRRFAAAKVLKEAGLTVGLLINPVLPYVTEHDLPALFEIAEESGLDFASFDTLHYLRGHVGGKMRRVYEQLDQKARMRLEQARNDPASYERDLRQLIEHLAEGQRLTVQTYF
ncbi:TPA: radical SAM protein [Candidatus Poribacteria bacterium]|nr:radical SAM protein [Candidatus Poribacteria bacterium]